MRVRCMHAESVAREMERQVSDLRIQKRLDAEHSDQARAQVSPPHTQRDSRPCSQGSTRYSIVWHVNLCAWGLPRR